MNYEKFSKIIFNLKPEDAHNLVEDLLKFSNFIPYLNDFMYKKFSINDPILEQSVFGLDFKNPVGLGAGFDRNATMLKPLSALGFSHIDVGSITRDPQVGAKKPRIFRMVGERSLQNAIGGYNDGSEDIFQRMKKDYPLKHNVILSANLAKMNNSNAKEAMDEFNEMVLKFDGVCDMFVFNLPSPNSSVLNSNEFKFSKDVIRLAKELTSRPIIAKLMGDSNLKFAPDFVNALIEEGIDGIIISHGSSNQKLLKDPIKGVITGKALASSAKELLEVIAKEINKKTILIASGGIEDANDAYERILLGASLIQLFTSMIFKGPFVAKNINEGIINLLKKDGFKNINEAIGAKLK